MKKIAVIVFVLMCSLSARAQEQRVELFGGYSYLGVVSGGFTSVPLGLQTDVDININRWFGVEGDVNYNSRFGVGILTVAGGPRFTVRGKRTDLFFHGLVGVTHVSVGGFGFSIGTNALTFGGGTGLNVRVQKHIAIRAFEADFGSTEQAGSFVNGVRLSSGVVFTFGGEHQADLRQNKRASDQSTTPVQEAATSEAALLGVSGYATEAGFRITSVRADSPAAQIYLNPGDTIFKIDGREVHNSRDIELAIAASASGTVKVTFRNQTALGAQSEREVKVR